MSKMYISCETLADWFADYDADKSQWVITELIANGEVLQQGGGKRKGGAA